MKKLFMLLAICCLFGTAAQAQQYYFVNHSGCTVGVRVYVYDGCPIPPGSTGASITGSFTVTLGPGGSYEFRDSNPSDWAGSLCGPSSLYKGTANTPNMGVPGADGCLTDPSSPPCSFLVRGCTFVTLTYNASLVSPSGTVGGFEIL